MAKTIEFTYKGKDYKLEYTRRTVKQMETAGFMIGDVPDKPLTLLPELFAGAFRAHHRNEKQETIDEIFSNIKDKSKMIEALGEMYREPLETLLEEKEESAENVEWVTSW